MSDETKHCIQVSLFIYVYGEQVLKFFAQREVLADEKIFSV